VPLGPALGERARHVDRGGDARNGEAATIEVRGEGGYRVRFVDARHDDIERWGHQGCGDHLVVPPERGEIWRRGHRPVRVGDQVRGDPEQEVVLRLTIGEERPGRIEEGLGIGKPLDLDRRFGHAPSLRGDGSRIRGQRLVCALLPPGGDVQRRGDRTDDPTNDHRG
jgi:hypothetical protein